MGWEKRVRDCNCGARLNSATSSRRLPRLRWVSGQVFASGGISCRSGHGRETGRKNWRPLCQPLPIELPSAAVTAGRIAGLERLWHGTDHRP